MYKYIWPIVFGASVIISLVLSETANAAQQELNFGIISTESSQVLKSRWQPFLDDMNKETSLKINAFFASDYAGIVTGMQFNKVQIAYYGNKAAIEAVDRAEGEVFAQMVDVTGSGGYYSAGSGLSGFGLAGFGTAPGGGRF